MTGPFAVRDFLQAQPVREAVRHWSQAPYWMKIRQVEYVRTWSRDPHLWEDLAQRTDVFIKALIYAQFPWKEIPDFSLLLECDFVKLDLYCDRYALAEQLIDAGDRDLTFETAGSLIRASPFFWDEQRVLWIKERLEETIAFLQKKRLLEHENLDPKFYRWIAYDPEEAIWKVFKQADFPALQMIAPLIIAIHQRVLLLRDPAVCKLLEVLPDPPTSTPFLPFRCEYLKLYIDRLTKTRLPCFRLMLEILKNINDCPRQESLNLAILFPKKARLILTALEQNGLTLSQEDYLHAVEFKCSLRLISH